MKKYNLSLIECMMIGAGVTLSIALLLLVVILLCLADYADLNIYSLLSVLFCVGCALLVGSWNKI
jgi:hypothetical protein